MILLLSGVVDVSVEPDDGDVVVEVARVELLVEEDVGGVVLHVRVELRVVVHVPLAQSDPEREDIVEADYAARLQDR